LFLKYTLIGFLRFNLSMSFQRYALVLSYCGEKHAGWQTQPEGNTVQDHVEKALSTIAVQPLSTVCAGRTDAGVHALAQVCHVDLPTSRPISAWVRGVNGLLDASIKVRSIHPVSEKFHARYWAVERCYRYVIFRGSVSNPLLHQRVGWVFRPLNVDVMRSAAQSLIGEHDFSSFRSSQCQATSPIRELRRIEFHEDGSLLFIEFRANAFLHHMIRNIVGALVEVGTAKRDMAWFNEMFEAKDRRLGAPTFAPDGLYFCGATYPEADTPHSLRIACEPSVLNKAQWWN
jgi:tRNA pseudouridine38-40 synthase